MFLNTTLKRNPKLIETALWLHQTDQILPDSYVIDMDTLIMNATRIIEESNKYGMKMYFMLKQLGRNPLIAKELMKLGYAGAVAVDFKEAKIMMDNHIPIGNVGHLVQPPKSMMRKLVDYGCEYFTIYSLEKVKELNDCLLNTDKKQKIMIRVIGKNDTIYSGQTAGITLEELEQTVIEIKKYEHIDIKGLTSFPCFLYDESTQKIEPTANLFTVLQANEILKKLGIVIDDLNTPSTTCVATIEEMSKYKTTSGEPGHGLTGTTPLHAHTVCVEVPCVVYVSEISHHVAGKSFCFGGGYYRRSHVENALIGTDINNLQKGKVITPDLDSIDYHFGLDRKYTINDTVLMAFRYQIFVTRSNVCIVEGIHSGNPKLVATYNSLGGKL